MTEGITVTFLPTAGGRGRHRSGLAGRRALRYLLTGGDALTRRPRPDLGFTVVNNYGLSETTVVATSGAVAPDGEGPPSIGRPIAGVVAEVVDERLQPVDAWRRRRAGARWRGRRARLPEPARAHRRAVPRRSARAAVPDRRPRAGARGWRDRVPRTPR